MLGLDDRIYGAVVTRRLRAMGIRDKPIAPASPWQNGFAERLIGSIRHECLDHVIIRGEARLRRILRSYGLWTKMRRSGGQFSLPESLLKSDRWRTLSPLHPNPGFSVHTTHFAIGIANSAPFAVLSGQRCMIDFCLV
jgi:transposase InsO family protein